MTIATPGKAPEPKPQPKVKRNNPYAQQYQTFRKYTEKHQLSVDFADGFHRQLRMVTPELGGMWGWGIITWRGHLATYGDIGAGFVFSRVEDMLTFFGVPDSQQAYYTDGSPCIDFRYWAEKIIGSDGYSRARRYSHEKFLQHVRDALDEHEDLGTQAQADYNKVVDVAQRLCTRHHVDYDAYVKDLREHHGRSSFDLEINYDDPDEVEYFERPIPLLSPAERHADLFGMAADLVESPDIARDWLDDHRETFGDETWDWDLEDFDSHFIYACYALELTTRHWRAHKARPVRDVTNAL